MDEMVAVVGYTSFTELTEIDHLEKDKVGSMSIMFPYVRRKPDVRAYWVQHFNPNESALALAVSYVRKLIPERSLRVASFREAFDLMPKDTSLGLRWLTSDRSHVGEYLERAQNVSSPEDIYPCVLYWRGQSAGLNKPPKQRVVWGFDHAETILGATILYPVLNALRVVPGFSAWLGDVYVDQAATRILQASNGRDIISMDYSGFDSSLHVRLLDAVDDILGSWFDETGSARIHLLGEISNTIPLVVPWDILRGRNGGMPSGSVLTNLRDTLANLIAGYYIGIRTGSNLQDFEVLGDDSIYLFEDSLTGESIAQCVSELGLESNPDKQWISSTSVHFLQRWHSLEYVLDGVCRGVRSPYRAVSGMLSYERWRGGWNKWMDSARWIMQSENVKNDPRFAKFVRWWKTGDSVLSSGIDPRVVFRKAGGADVIRSVLSIASFPFNVQNPERVNEFETTRILREG